MSLPPPARPRALKHTRNVSIEVYRRDDDLWEIDARLTDTKKHDTRLPGLFLPADKPIHDLWLRLTVDDQSIVVEVEAVLSASPFPGFCDAIAPAYKKMIGLNLLKGFRTALRERLHGLEGCTHLNELAAILPTAAIQTFSFNDLENRSDPGGENSDVKPFELDNCHALRTDGEAVALYYPRWVVTKSN